MKNLRAPTSPQSGGRRGRKRSAEVEAAILDATIELLSTQSLREITSDSIAQKAGVSKATIYKWWKNKSQVALDAFLSRISQEVSIPDTGSAERDFAEQLRDVIRFHQSWGGRIFCQFIAEGQSDPEFLALFRSRFMHTRREAVAIMWERGVARGEIDPAWDREIVLDLLYGPLVFRLLAGHAPLNDSEAEALTAVAFAGLRKRPESPP